MDNVCRVCLNDGTLVSLFNEDNSVKLSDKIMYCASIQIKPGDELPSQICLLCVERLNMSYEFKALCEHSDLMLRKKILTENFHSNNFISIKKEKPEASDFQSGIKYEIDEEFCSYGKKNGIETHGKIMNESVIVKANIKCELLDKTHCPKKKNEKRKCTYDNKCAFKRTNGNICETVLDDSRYAPSPVEDSRLSYTSDNSDNVALLDHHDDMKRVINSENDVCKKKIPEKKKRRTKIHGSESNIKKRKKTSKQQKEQCFTCGKVMSSRFRLEMHLRIHTGEKPFTCKYCQKTFTLSQNLKVHERVHTGEKPLLCGTCGKGFAQSAGLVAHMRLHTGETPYKCTLCPMSFRTPGHLQYHIRQHTGEKNFVCKICNRAFITKGDLTQHTKTHTGERRFVCTICGLRMSRSSHLSRHMMTHTGEKPHKCTYCDSSYTQKGDLVRHVKKNHNKNGIILSKHIESTVPAELSLNVKCDDVNMKIPTKHLREEF